MEAPIEVLEEPVDVESLRADGLECFDEGAEQERDGTLENRGGVIALELRG